MILFYENKINNQGRVKLNCKTHKLVLNCKKKLYKLILNKNFLITMFKEDM